MLNKYKIDSSYFVYTGSAYPSKDLPTLLQALKNLNQNPSVEFSKENSTSPFKKGDSIKLLIACARSVFWEKLQKMIQEMNLNSQVLLPGRIPDEDLVVLYQNAAAFVMPSLMEGFGLPALEAMAVGCPIISSNAGSLPEIYGNIATYFTAGNSDDLAKKMQEVLELNKEERRKIIDKGIKYTKQFNWDKAGKEVLNLYEKN
ncbi:glycosyltransferase family 4 protein [Candidatus Beckwithbacteria bacterium]|nr:glycosyltransferase family 4 protein [Candidatus Beckwithbacteria bacterium]